MAKTLTAPAVERLRAGKQRREIADGGCAGLYLQIGATGAKSWTYRYRRPGSGKPDVRPMRGSGTQRRRT